MDEMVEMFCELRKSKGVTPEQAREILYQNNYFGTMLVKMGIADSLLGGATYSTADTVRPALQLIKTRPGNTLVSSCFILVRPFATGGNEVFAMGDCGINIKPNEDELVEIAEETVRCARIFGVDPKVAFLSYSTYGSGEMQQERQRSVTLIFRSQVRFSSMQPYHLELQRRNVHSQRLQEMQIPLSSLISMQEISVIRLHREWVTSQHMARSC